MQREASIDDQVRSCRDYAARQGLTVVETYSDRAVSGASLMRSGIQKLLGDGRNGVFDVVISEGLDRLNRNQADIAQIYQTLGFSEVMIKTVIAAITKKAFTNEALLDRLDRELIADRDRSDRQRSEDRKADGDRLDRIETDIRSMRDMLFDAFQRGRSD
jgi:hypothetical protein